MTTDRFTVFGLGLAAIGWTMLIADVVIGPFLASDGHIASVASVRADVFTVAQTTIVSGFALAIIGALRMGFGALNRFFEEVLARAGTPRPAAAPPTAPATYPEPPVVTIEPEVIVPNGGSQAKPAAGKTGRNYTIRPDGAVEVETLLGTRVFASMDEARGFIR